MATTSKTKRTTRKSEPRCIMCGEAYPREELAVDLSHLDESLPVVCRHCAHAFLEATYACHDPETMAHLQALGLCYERGIATPGCWTNLADFMRNLVIMGQEDIVERCGINPKAVAPEAATGKRRSEFDDSAAGASSASAAPRRKKEAGLSWDSLQTPKEIYDYLSQYCYGQEEAKRTLSVAVFNHYKRVLFERQQLAKGIAPQDTVELTKSNVLMVGPTGSGKTLLAQALARLLKVPFAISDATTLTEAGYVGEDVENILLRLVQAADYDLEKAEVGIVYVDEIDKIARKTQNVSITRDVSGEGVQQALLKIVENTVANIPPKGGRKHPDQEYIHLNTKNILFICGGAFVGLDKIVSRRGGSRQLGFLHGGDGESADEAVARKEQEDIAKNPLNHVEPEDLVQFGLIPEFVGRLPIIASLKELSQDDLLHILTEPKNSLVKQYQELMKLSGIELTITQDALEAVAAIAHTKGTGARGLRAILEKRMLDVMFEIPKASEGLSGECIVDAGVIRGEKPAELVMHKKGTPELPFPA